MREGLRRDRAPDGARSGAGNVRGGGVDARRQAGRPSAAEFVITDLKMEGVGGLDVVKAAARTRPRYQVMIVTAFGTVETAVEAMHLGAFDLPAEAVRSRGRAVEGGARAGAARRTARPRARRGRGPRRAVARGRRRRLPLRRDRRRHARHARRVPIIKVTFDGRFGLVHSESGTGKELVARAIHARSKRPAARS